MDHNLLSRKFIVLAKKLRDDIRKAVPGLRTEIEKIGRKIEANTAEYHAAYNKEQPAPIVTAVLNRPQSEIDKEDARATRHEGRDRTRLSVETVGIILGAILAVATIGQWIVTKRAVRIAAKSADAAERSALASESQAKATQQSIEASIEQFRLEQRAWVGVGDIQIQLTLNRPVIAAVKMTNTGKTPAVRVEGVTIFNTTRKKLNHIDELKSEWFRKAAPLLPELPIYSPAEPLTKGPADVLTQAGMDAITKGELFIYVYGEIKYFDVFGTQRFTKFCGEYYPKGGGFGVCNFPFVDAN